jgi:four helix bundle protein
MQFTGIGGQGAAKKEDRSQKSEVRIKNGRNGKRESEGKKQEPGIGKSQLNAVHRDRGTGIWRKTLKSRSEGSETRGLQKKMDFKSYRDLEVWQKAMDLVVLCYQITKKFPKSEMYGLASQLQRSAVSVPANIAEGRERQHSREFLQHLSIAYSSLAELETHLQIAERLKYIELKRLNQILDKTREIGRMLNGLRRSIEKKA